MKKMKEFEISKLLLKLELEFLPTPELDTAKNF